MAAVAIPPRPPSTPSAHHHHSSCNDRHPSTISSPPPPSSEAVYTTLIQTYLNLLCYDNAMFLAERCAASFPASENAIYLLAYSYYRSGNAKGARSVLLSRWLGRNNDRRGRRPQTQTTPTVTNDDGPDIDLECTRGAAGYLLAKCCYDLHLYSEAEETLLKHCRESFAKAVAEGGGKINGVKIKGNRDEVMDAWIVSDSQRVPNPIPNGAAGLYLLGNICRKTSRRERAMAYYRLSLTLDPLMWTSYEALCELGGPGSAAKGRGEGRSKDRDEDGSSGIGRVEEVDDPHVIFGVESRHDLLRGHEQQSHHATIQSAGGDKHYTANLDSTVGDVQQQHSLHSFQPNTHYGTPSTPYTSFNNMNIGSTTEHSVINHHQQRQTMMQSSMGAGVDFHLPATASTRGRRSVLPQTNLFAATPELSETPIVAATTPMAVHDDDAGGGGGMSPPPSAIGYANKVLHRARRVVAGLAYEASPDMSFRGRPPPASARPPVAEAAAAATSMDVGDEANAEPTFSSTPLPSAVHSRAFPSYVNEGAAVSTVKGEKRALFAATHEKEETESRKSSKKEEPLLDCVTGQHQEQDCGESSLSGTRSHHVKSILQLLCDLGAAYKCLCQYSSQEALDLFRQLPPEQINTGWIQHQIGKAYFEMTDYRQAHRALEQMHKIEPHRIKGLDILSTTLWQLKREVELSDLAQQVVEFDKMAPEAWFVVGNCFSLQKEHETAIMFFRRAIQLSPTYTYAHTLCGHEYTSNEDFERAISCYRDAIRVDCRHYNAWYGLGAIYFRQEKFDLAEYHFQRALDINSQSSVLHCHLGMAQHQNSKTMEALDTLAGAFRLDPRNPQAHYQRATIFMTLDRPEDALSELEKVRSAAPKEASVHFNMGKVYKRLGQPAKAMRCFLTALDLDPKDNNLIKAAMDRLDEPNVEEEVSVF